MTDEAKLKFNFSEGEFVTGMVSHKDRMIVSTNKHIYEVVQHVLVKMAIVEIDSDEQQKQLN